MIYFKKLVLINHWIPHEPLKVMKVMMMGLPNRKPWTVAPAMTPVPFCDAAPEKQYQTNIFLLTKAGSTLCWLVLNGYFGTSMGHFLKNWKLHTDHFALIVAQWERLLPCAPSHMLCLCSPTSKPFRGLTPKSPIPCLVFVVLVEGCLQGL